jgi:MFS family permease
MHAVQFGLVLWLERAARHVEHVAKKAPNAAEEPDFAQHHVSPAAAKMFLRMAWVANPFAYVAMNTLIPLAPDLAAQFGLSTAQAGFVASVWMFARLGAFALLWRWTGWHYRFAWLMWSYVVMIGSFATVFLTANLAVLVCAQLAFGLAVGLIYYSSLFYSMDVGAESQGEHGGYHETVIGAGLFAGPAVGAAVGYLAHGATHSNVLAVTAVLLSGLPALLVVRGKSQVTSGASASCDD